MLYFFHMRFALLSIAALICIALGVTLSYYVVNPAFSSRAKTAAAPATSHANQLYITVLSTDTAAHTITASVVSPVALDAPVSLSYSPKLVALRRTDAGASEQVDPGTLAPGAHVLATVTESDGHLIASNLIVNQNL